MKIVTVNQMRAIEQQADRLGLPSKVLMENAGLAVARHTRTWLGSVLGRPFLVLVGPGNNGGDGLVVARHLHDWGASVTICTPTARSESDINCELCRRRGIRMVEGPDQVGEAFDTLLAAAEVVVDAFFGTGSSRPLDGAFRQALLKVRDRRAGTHSPKVVALDLPSGLNADTGATDQACLAADLTITLGCPKHGLFLFPGAGMVGELVVADIGIPAQLADHVTTEMITPGMARDILPKRPPDANKGTFGRVLVCGGSMNYIGAMYLACEAALRAGAGLVTLATPASLQPILASKLTEVTYAPLPESDPGVVAADAATTLGPFLREAAALLIGCGLGQSQAALALVESLVLGPGRLPPVVLDADALNLMSRVPRWWQRLPSNAILTPHPGEMSRLAGLPVADVQSRRLAVARDSAILWGKTVVLKGACTIVASPDGATAVSPTSNPGLASGGTGDVLAGVIAGLAAQGLGSREAAIAGVFIHSLAGEMARGRMGRAGMLASDLLPLLPVAIRDTQVTGPG